MAKQMMDSSYNMPTDITINILSRLTVKSVIRCTSVCKSWFSLIKNPFFIASHLNFNSDKSTNTGYIVYGEINICHVICGATFKILHSIETPFNVRIDRISWLDFVGLCNGLLCLALAPYTCNLGKDVYIWNPLINKYKKLPPSRFSHMFTNNDDLMMYFSLGFCFHESMNDYKVVRLVNFRKHTSVTEEARYVEVYSLRNDAWKIVHCEVPPISVNRNATFHKGVLYWCTIDCFECCIMSFDVHDERFRILCEQPWHVPCCCAEVKGSSNSLFAVERDIFSENNDVSEAWKMDENGRAWTKAYEIRYVLWTIGFTRSNKFLFTASNKRLVSLNLESLKTEYPDIGIPFSRCALVEPN